ncbi:putative ATP-dependent helicase-like [Iris pallida]|uniref:ATP-dependent helicase-like n=1 Tax=Iris pallida TaxID=29817 RepID=A0AAX6G9W1_IRIPA|nr:putative ATP-dependent helicase-like [Iris pallida]
MGSRGRPVFDLNEPPAEEEDEMGSVQVVMPQKAFPTSTPTTPNFFQPLEGCQRIVNNHAFKHASSCSVFQPFVRIKEPERSKESLGHKEDDSNPYETDNNTPQVVSEGGQNSQVVEREEGEWSDMEGNEDTLPSNASANCDTPSAEIADGQRTNKTEHISIVGNGDNNSSCLGDYNSEVGDTNKEPKVQVLPDSEGRKTLACNSKGHAPLDTSDEPLPAFKPKEVKGVEASHALRISNNHAKKAKLDEQKEAMLGKKRARQTVFINVEDAKQAGPIKTSTPKRQTSFPSIVTRTVKDTSRACGIMTERTTERQNQQHIIKDQKQADTNTGRSIPMEVSGQKAEANGDVTSGAQSRPRKKGGCESPSEMYLPNISKQASLKPSGDSRQFKNPPASSRVPIAMGQNISDSKMGGKKHLPSKRPTSTYQSFQSDASVERLLREVTSDKFWRHPEETELQCVPGCFDSFEEYVKVFEPLLFEECRAQLYSTWEELAENFRDAHPMVRVKTLERRDRGWYDVTVLPNHECKWTFKEGDVAILSSQRPTTAKSNKRNNNTGANREDGDPDVSGRVVGTVRRFVPTDTRDPHGAILHFYIEDSSDSNGKADDDHILRKLQPRSLWYLTVLGSVTTTQREYVALHAFHRLNMQMQTAILKPSPEHFPKYEEQSPSMPECFTQSFIDHLRRSFNVPQLSAIQWAATHTAAGTSSGAVRRQEPWPFTLVQGPPGTGKTHTVWGMLNVIHLVQYQHYYAALLKKLAPESYKQSSECVSESASMGSIDEVLQSMDQNLLRTLPKLCPKPRMLVCAPSNAATDELLSRVLERGFIDGEMKVYRPDVARVGVDSQTRAAQAVSVERRTEQLLLKSREEVLGWMHQQRVREAQFSQQISLLQRQLTYTAVQGRSQGSVGVDPDVLVARDQNRDVLLQNLAQVVEERDKVLVEMTRLCILEGRFRAGGNFNLEEARAQLEASFANEAEIVFTTVSSSGRRLFSRLSHGFDMVVIDEAAQASEVALLPPLSLGAARCVLVGDPQQLPATVISKAAGTLLYSRSLFERFQQAGCPTMLLSVQYRMHPKIRDFPSRYFYQGRLIDSETVANLADEIYYKDPLLQPYVFYDITHGRESHRGGSASYQNIHEAQFSLQLYEHLHKFLKSNGGKKVSLGIITPYKLQLKCIQREFEEVLNSEDGKDIYINTVDAFQGQERDVIIMSCVRASSNGVGFVADIRRMNVALTRARRALWVVGNANALMQSDDWAALITDAKSRNCFVDMESIPKELLVPKGSTHGPPGLVSSKSTRNLRTGGQRYRHLEMHQEIKSRGQSEDDEKPNSFGQRNGSYREMKQSEGSLDDLEQSGARDAIQHGLAKRENISRGL